MKNQVRPDAKVSAVGKRVARFRHWCRGNWPVFEAVGVVLMMALGAWMFLVLMIGAVPVER